MRIACRILTEPAPAAWPGGLLFPLLERLLPVGFVVGPLSERSETPSLIVRQPRTDERRTPQLGTAPSLCVTAPGEPGAPLLPSTVQFSSDAEVPPPFRGRRLTTGVAADWSGCVPQAEERVLASVDRTPVWTVRDTPGGPQYRSSLALPSLPPEGAFGDVFSGERFLALLPLIHFLRRMDLRAYQPPPLRAAYIIDDPNLHWPRYGYVDYRAVAERARRENYHVAFATMPIDTWFTHASAVRVFRSHPNALSLLVHGNNHLKDELARHYTAEGRIALLRQALRRVERLERKSGLHVDRVMVPPHGACSAEMLAAMPRCGFEAACVSAGSLRAHNAGRPWTRTLGYLPSDTVEDCSVLPRWAIGPHVESTILLAAYLGQAIVLRGHHRDLRHGLEVLDESAAVVNRLGAVRWSGLSEIARRNYRWRLDGSQLRVQAFGASLDVEPPAGAASLTIDWTGESDDGSWQLRFADDSVAHALSGEAVPLRVGGMVQVQRLRPPPVVAPVREQSINARAVARRLLTEARDRLLVG